MEHSGNIPIFNIPGTLFGNISRNFKGNFFSDILGIYHGNIPLIFYEYIFPQWDIPHFSFQVVYSFCKQQRSSSGVVPQSSWCCEKHSKLKKMVWVSKQFNMYEPMRPSQILLSEKKVTEIVRLLEDKFIKSFGVGYEHLYSPSSVDEVADDLASAILDVRQNGTRMKEEFVRSRITAKLQNFMTH